MGELAEGNELPPSLGGTELDSVLEQVRIVVQGHLPASLRLSFTIFYKE